MTTTKKNLTLMSFILATIIFFSFDLPSGWFIAGSLPEMYEMGVDYGAGQNGKNAATIKSIQNNIDGFGTLMQHCLPGKFLGKRVRMSGMLKTKDVSDWAGLWLPIILKDTDISSLPQHGCLF